MFVHLINLKECLKPLKLDFTDADLLNNYLKKIHESNFQI